MKKMITLFGIICIAGNVIFAQFALTSKTHGLMPDTKNPMKLIEYIEPGTGGMNVVWDFSIIKEKENFEGEITGVSGVSSPVVAGANVLLKEFNNRFVFNLCDDKLEQLGYYGGEKADNYTRYDVPFVKMKYPFSFGSAYSGNFSGGQYSGEKLTASISGTYEVSADGFGTLILPNGIVYKNALRVKEVKRTMNSGNGYEEVTYRWYLKNHRYPVLVFIRTGSLSNGGCSSFLSAYNPNIPELKSITGSDEEADNAAKISVYPNPSNDNVYAKIGLDKESKLDVKIFDATGKFIAQVANGSYAAGEQTISFSAKGLALKYGVYFLKISINGNESVKTFVIE